jgi:hypothetical protein
MVCATCDFGDPCACERKRLASGPAALQATVRRRDEPGRLEARLGDASNMIAALLLAGGSELPRGLVDEAEALLEALRGEAQ